MRVTIHLDVPNNITEENIERWLERAFGYVALLNYRSMYNIKGPISMATRAEVVASWHYSYVITGDKK